MATGLVDETRTRTCAITDAKRKQVQMNERMADDLAKARARNDELSSQLADATAVLVIAHDKLISLNEELKAAQQEIIIAKTDHITAATVADRIAESEFDPGPTEINIETTSNLARADIASLWQHTRRPRSHPRWWSIPSLSNVFSADENDKRFKILPRLLLKPTEDFFRELWNRNGNIPPRR